MICPIKRKGSWVGCLGWQRGRVRTFFLFNPFPLFQIKVEPLNSYFSIIQRKKGTFRNQWQSLINSLLGMVGPAHGLCLLMVLGGNVDRVFWCQNLYIAHFSLLTTFSNTAFFSHTFRSILIRFPDRGLVLHGRQNLKLFSPVQCSAGIFNHIWCLSLCCF